VAALKTDPQAALVPLVVVCAAAADAAVVETFYRAGANACVRLPDDAAAIEAVAAALAGFWLGANEVPPSLS
jgi:CheY-like chemotaxis protein